MLNIIPYLVIMFLGNTELFSYYCSLYPAFDSAYYYKHMEDGYPGRNVSLPQVKNNICLVFLLLFNAKRQNLCLHYKNYVSNCCLRLCTVFLILLHTPCSPVDRFTQSLKSRSGIDSYILKYKNLLNSKKYINLEKERLHQKSEIYQQTKLYINLAIQDYLRSFRIIRLTVFE